MKDYCNGCIYNGGNLCKALPGRVRTLVIGLCRESGWRVKRLGRGVKHAKSTGQYAVSLEIQYHGTVVDG